MLIVEDGSGLAAAEAYVSVADADTYHSNRGNAAWALLATPEKEIALRKGADYMTQTYRLSWAGYRVNDTQALDWPRYEVPRPDAFGINYGSFRSYVPFDSVPREVANANCELAVRASTSEELLADIDPPVTSEQVGPISVTYARGENKSKRYPAIDRMLMPFLSGHGGMKVVRA